MRQSLHYLGTPSVPKTLTTDMRVQRSDIQGDIATTVSSLIGFRSNATFTGTLTCDATSEIFGPLLGLAAVQCNQECAGGLGTCDNLTAELSISGNDPFEFGPTLSNTISTTSFTITNSGNGSANINGTIFEGTFNFWDGTYPGKFSDCESVIISGESCTISLEFNAPTETGVYQGKITLEYHDGVTSQTLTKNLTGRSF